MSITFYMQTQGAKSTFITIRSEEHGFCVKALIFVVWKVWHGGIGTPFASLTWVIGKKSSTPLSKAYSLILTWDNFIFKSEMLFLRYLKDRSLRKRKIFCLQTIIYILPLIKDPLSIVWYYSLPLQMLWKIRIF